MIYLQSRFISSTKACATHFLLSLLVAAASAGLVFGFWFPWPYPNMAGGTELFWLIVSVDVVCGPLLTFVLYNPKKSRRELWTDLTLVGVIQMVALIYGVWTIWNVRPLYFPFEFDRFKVVSRNDLRSASTEQLPNELQPGFFKGPIQVGLRPPRDADEQQRVLLESVSGGADYGERPDFYVTYSADIAKRALAKGKPLKDFLSRYPGQQIAAEKLVMASKQTIDSAKFLPIRSRNDWVAVLDKNGFVAGYLQGDGF